LNQIFHWDSFPVNEEGHLPVGKTGDFQEAADESSDDDDDDDDDDDESDDDDDEDVFHLAHRHHLRDDEVNRKDKIFPCFN